MILIGRGLVLADDFVDDFSFEGASPSSGDDSQVVTPVPMPNTEVKHLNAESSWGLPPVRIGRCQAIEKDRSASCRSVLFLFNRQAIRYSLSARTKSIGRKKEKDYYVVYMLNQADSCLIKSKKSIF